MNYDRPNRPNLEMLAAGRKPLFVRLLQWRYVIPFTLLLILLGAPLVYRSYLLNGVPDIGDPFDVEAFGTVDLPDAENARVEYEKAVALMVPLPRGAGNTADEELSLALDNDWSYASPTIRRWLEDNRPALEEWKRGTEKPDFLYVQPKTLSINTLLTLIQEMRTFAWLAQLETSRLLAEGKPAEAVIWAKAAFHNSRHLGQHGVAIERLVGIAIYAVCIDGMLMPIAEHPAATEELLTEMLRDIQEHYTKTPANSTMMKCEYLMIMNTIHDPKVMDGLLAMTGSRSAADQTHLQLVQFLRIEPIFGRLIAQQYWANVLDQIDLPLTERQDQTGKLALFDRDPAKTYPADWLTSDEIEDNFWKSILARNILPAYIHLDTACLREASRQRAFELCLALRIYHLRHGEYPPNLETLVAENIIAEIPIDPYSSTGEKMRYRNAGNEAFAWSIGENGIDEGGGEVDSEYGDRSQIDIGLILGREKDDSVEAQKP